MKQKRGREQPRAQWRQSVLAFFIPARVGGWPKPKHAGGRGSTFKIGQALALAASFCISPQAPGMPSDLQLRAQRSQIATTQS